MEKNIKFAKNVTTSSSYYDESSHTLRFDHIENETIYLDFDCYFPDSLVIEINHCNLNIIETYKGTLPNSNYQIKVDKNSSLYRLSIMVDLDAPFVLKKDVFNHGDYTSMQIDLTENNITSIENINMIENGAKSLILDGIYASATAKKNYQTNLNHEVINTTSKVQIFAINHEKAHVNIFTDAYIKRGAHGAKANQEGRIINLSDECEGIVLPNLHIDENDVEASHSCSVGSVNKDHLYYLQTRGFTPEQAENILIRGYFNPLLGSIKDENMRNSLIEVLEKRIG